ncbi:MAG: methyltransferase protein [Burkholderiales bacterium]|nr:methyltransferase protein [Burkholderiales bacterium]
MAQADLSFDDSAAYERFMGRWSRAVAPVFLGWLGAPRGGRWLDVGCGTGILAETILELSGPRSVHAVDFVASALVINFIPDRPPALAEMRRVARPGGVVAGYVWDFAEELSPSGPLRRAMRRFGAEVPAIPGAEASRSEALRDLFQDAELEQIEARTIDVCLAYADFRDFWHAQTPGYAPTTKIIAAMRQSERTRLMHAVQSALPCGPNGSIEYCARANAIKARVPS